MTAYFLALLLFAYDAETAAKPEIRIHVFVEPGNPGFLNMELTYELDHPLEIRTDDLPWKNRYSLPTVAMEAEKYYPLLQQLYQVDDPGLSRSVLQPGGVLSGRIDLLERFPNLIETLKRTDVILFWTYQLKAVNGHTFERCGGWIEIPRSAGGCGGH